MTIAVCLRCGEHRQVLMHAWLSSVHWDTALKVCEVYASVSGSQGQVKGDGLSISS